MINHLYYSLSSFIALTKPNDKVIDNIIEKKHSYLVIKLKNGSEYLISTSQYKPNSFRYDYSTEMASLTVIYNKKSYQLNEIVEAFGCQDFEVALDLCGPNTDCLCTKPEEKLIFSPQLTKWLLKHHFQITDIKEKRDGSGQVIHVFLVEPGFYPCIKEWKEQQSENQ